MSEHMRRLVWDAVLLTVALYLAVTIGFLIGEYEVEARVARRHARGVIERARVPEVAPPPAPEPDTSGESQSEE